MSLSVMRFRVLLDFFFISDYPQWNPYQNYPGPHGPPQEQPAPPNPAFHPSMQDPPQQEVIQPQQPPEPTVPPPSEPLVSTPDIASIPIPPMPPKDPPPPPTDIPLPGVSASPVPKDTRGETSVEEQTVPQPDVSDINLKEPGESVSLKVPIETAAVVPVAMVPPPAPVPPPDDMDSIQMTLERSRQRVVEMDVPPMSPGEPEELRNVCETKTASGETTLHVESTPMVGTSPTAELEAEDKDAVSEKEKETVEEVKEEPKVVKTTAQLLLEKVAAKKKIQADSPDDKEGKMTSLRKPVSKFLLKQTYKPNIGQSSEPLVVKEKPKMSTGGPKELFLPSSEDKIELVTQNMTPRQKLMYMERLKQFEAREKAKKTKIFEVKRRDPEPEGIFDTADSRVSYDRKGEADKKDNKESEGKNVDGTSVSKSPSDMRAKEGGGTETKSMKSSPRRSRSKERQLHRSKSSERKTSPKQSKSGERKGSPKRSLSKDRRSKSRDRKSSPRRSRSRERRSSPRRSRSRDRKTALSGSRSRDRRSRSRDRWTSSRRSRSRDRRSPRRSRSRDRRSPRRSRSRDRKVIRRRSRDRSPRSRSRDRTVRKRSRSQDRSSAQRKSEDGSPKRSREKRNRRSRSPQRTDSKDGRRREISTEKSREKESERSRSRSQSHEKQITKDRSRSRSASKDTTTTVSKQESMSQIIEKDEEKSSKHHSKSPTRPKSPEEELSRSLPVDKKSRGKVQRGKLPKDGPEDTADSVEQSKEPVEQEKSTSTISEKSSVRDVFDIGQQTILNRSKIGFSFPKIAGPIVKSKWDASPPHMELEEKSETSKDVDDKAVDSQSNIDAIQRKVDNVAPEVEVKEAPSEVPPPPRIYSPGSPTGELSQLYSPGSPTRDDSVERELPPIADGVMLPKVGKNPEEYSPGSPTRESPELSPVVLTKPPFMIADNKEIVKAEDKAINEVEQDESVKGKEGDKVDSARIPAPVSEVRSRSKSPKKLKKKKKKKGKKAQRRSISPGETDERRTKDQAREGSPDVKKGNLDSPSPQVEKDVKETAKKESKFSKEPDGTSDKLPQHQPRSKSPSPRSNRSTSYSPKRSRKEKKKPKLRRSQSLSPERLPTKVPAEQNMKMSPERGRSETSKSSKTKAGKQKLSKKRSKSRSVEKCSPISSQQRRSKSPEKSQITKRLRSLSPQQHGSQSPVNARKKIQLRRSRSRSPPKKEGKYSVSPDRESSYAKEQESRRQSRSKSSSLPRRSLTPKRQKSKSPKRGGKKERESRMQSSRSPSPSKGRSPKAIGRKQQESRRKFKSRSSSSPRLSASPMRKRSRSPKTKGKKKQESRKQSRSRSLSLSRYSASPRRQKSRSPKAKGKKKQEPYRHSRSRSLSSSRRSVSPMRQRLKGKKKEESSRRSRSRSLSSHRRSPSPRRSSRSPKRKGRKNLETKTRSRSRSLSSTRQSPLRKRPRSRSPKGKKIHESRFHSSSRSLSPRRISASPKRKSKKKSKRLSGRGEERAMSTSQSRSVSPEQSGRKDKKKEGNKMKSPKQLQRESSLSPVIRSTSSKHSEQGDMDNRGDPSLKSSGKERKSKKSPARRSSRKTTGSPARSLSPKQKEKEVKAKSGEWKPLSKTSKKETSQSPVRRSQVKPRTGKSKDNIGKSPAGVLQREGSASPNRRSSMQFDRGAKVKESLQKSPLRKSLREAWSPDGDPYEQKSTGDRWSSESPELAAKVESPSRCKSSELAPKTESPSRRKSLSLSPTQQKQSKGSNMSVEHTSSKSPVRRSTSPKPKKSKKMKKAKKNKRAKHSPEMGMEGRDTLPSVHASEDQDKDHKSITEEGKDTIKPTAVPSDLSSSQRNTIQTKSESLGNDDNAKITPNKDCIGGDVLVEKEDPKVSASDVAVGSSPDESSDKPQMKTRRRSWRSKGKNDSKNSKSSLQETTTSSGFKRISRSLPSDAVVVDMDLCDSDSNLSVKIENFSEDKTKAEVKQDDGIKTETIGMKDNLEVEDMEISQENDDRSTTDNLQLEDMDISPYRGDSETLEINLPDVKQNERKMVEDDRYGNSNINGGDKNSAVVQGEFSTEDRSEESGLRKSRKSSENAESRIQRELRKLNIDMVKKAYDFDDQEPKRRSRRSRSNKSEDDTTGGGEETKQDVKAGRRSRSKSGIEEFTAAEGENITDENKSRKGTRRQLSKQSDASDDGNSSTMVDLASIKLPGETSPRPHRIAESSTSKTLSVNLKDIMLPKPTLEESKEKVTNQSQLQTSEVTESGPVSATRTPTSEDRSSKRKISDDAVTSPTTPVGKTGLRIPVKFQLPKAATTPLSKGKWEEEENENDTPRKKPLFLVGRDLTETGNESTVDDSERSHEEDSAKENSFVAYDSDPEISFKVVDSSLTQEPDAEVISRTDPVDSEKDNTDLTSESENDTAPHSAFEIDTRTALPKGFSWKKSMTEEDKGDKSSVESDIKAIKTVKPISYEQPVISVEPGKKLDDDMDICSGSGSDIETVEMDDSDLKTDETPPPPPPPPPLQKKVSPIQPSLPVAPVQAPLPLAPVLPLLPVASVQPPLPVAPVEPPLPVAPVQVPLPVAPVHAPLPVAPVQARVPVSPANVTTVSPLFPISDTNVSPVPPPPQMGASKFSPVPPPKNPVDAASVTNLPYSSPAPVPAPVGPVKPLQAKQLKQMEDITKYYNKMLEHAKMFVTKASQGESDVQQTENAKNDKNTEMLDIPMPGDIKEKETPPPPPPPKVDAEYPPLPKEPEKELPPLPSTSTPVFPPLPTAANNSQNTSKMEIPLPPSETRVKFLQAAGAKGASCDIPLPGERNIPKPTTSVKIKPNVSLESPVISVSKAEVMEFEKIPMPAEITKSSDDTAKMDASVFITKKADADTTSSDDVTEEVLTFEATVENVDLSKISLPTHAKVPGDSDRSEALVTASGIIDVSVKASGSSEGHLSEPLVPSKEKFMLLPKTVKEDNRDVEKKKTKPVIVKLPALLEKSPLAEKETKSTAKKGPSLIKIGPITMSSTKDVKGTEAMGKESSEEGEVKTDAEEMAGPPKQTSPRGTVLPQGTNIECVLTPRKSNEESISSTGFGIITKKALWDQAEKMEESAADRSQLSIQSSAVSSMSSDSDYDKKVDEFLKKTEGLKSTSYEQKVDEFLKKVEKPKTTVERKFDEFLEKVRKPTSERKEEPTEKSHKEKMLEKKVDEFLEKTKRKERGGYDDYSSSRHDREEYEEKRRSSRDHRDDRHRRSDRRDKDRDPDDKYYSRRDRSPDYSRRDRSPDYRRDRSPERNRDRRRSRSRSRERYRERERSRSRSRDRDRRDRHRSKRSRHDDRRRDSVDRRRDDDGRRRRDDSSSDEDRSSKRLSRGKSDREDRGQSKERIKEKDRKSEKLKDEWLKLEAETAKKAADGASSSITAVTTIGQSTLPQPAPQQPEYFQDAYGNYHPISANVNNSAEYYQSYGNYPNMSAQPPVNQYIAPAAVPPQVAQQPGHPQTQVAMPPGYVQQGGYPSNQGLFQPQQAYGPPGQMMQPQEMYGVQGNMPQPGPMQQLGPMQQPGQLGIPGPGMIPAPHTMIPEAPPMMAPGPPGLPIAPGPGMTPGGAPPGLGPQGPMLGVPDPLQPPVQQQMQQMPGSGPAGVPMPSQPVGFGPDSRPLPSEQVRSAGKAKAPLLPFPFPTQKAQTVPTSSSQKAPIVPSVTTKKPLEHLPLSSSAYQQFESQKPKALARVQAEEDRSSTPVPDSPDSPRENPMGVGNFLSQLFDSNDKPDSSVGNQEAADDSSQGESDGVDKLAENLHLQSVGRMLPIKLGIKQDFQAGKEFEPTTPQTASPQVKDGKPEKVKSRWRRFSELDMGSPTGMMSPNQESSAPSSTVTEGGATKLETTPVKWKKGMVYDAWDPSSDLQLSPAATKTTKKEKENSGSKKEKKEREKSGVQNSDVTSQTVERKEEEKENVDDPNKPPYFEPLDENLYLTERYNSSIFILIISS